MIPDAMTQRELVALLTSLGVQPSRRLGQNFLVDRNMLAAMLRDAAPRAAEPILEIGPGTGVLTRPLLDAGCQVTAVELDSRLAAYLRDTLGSHPNLRLIHADACALNYDEVMPVVPFRCLANLPYSVTGVLLSAMAELRNPPVEMYLLLQREAAERLAAGPGCKAYGALTVRVRMTYDVDLIRRLPATVFYPPPAVASAYVRLRLRAERPSAALRKRVDDILRLAFGQRRKQMARFLAARFGQDAVRAAFAALDIPADARAEQVGVNAYVALAQRLEASGPGPGAA